MVSPKLIMGRIVELEGGCNVHLNYLGVDCWPVVRNTYMALVTHNKKKSEVRVGVLSFLRAFFDFFSLFFRQENSFSLILTDHKYSKKGEGFGDASVIKELLAAKGLSSTLVSQSSLINKGVTETARTVYMLTIISSVLARLFKVLDRSNEVELYVDSLLSRPELEGLHQDNKAIKARLIRNIYFAVIAKILFVQLLKRLRIRKCFVICYYSSLGMALCSACRDLGIEVVDIQHGVSGSSMRAYGNWTSFPDNGLNTLPTSFYCWSHMDYVAIKRWASSTDGRHTAYLTGKLSRRNVYRAGVAMFNEAIGEGVEIANACSRCERVIVFCGQHTLVPDIIQEVLLKCPESWFFLIRLHPDLKKEELNKAQKLFQSYHANINVIQATTLPIHKVMQMSDLHVTEWSGAVYDAFFEGVDSVVLSDYGNDYFEDFSNLGIVKRLYTAEDLISHILTLDSERSISKSFQKESVIENLADIIGGI